jgi:hypothetical protein
MILIVAGVSFTFVLYTANRIKTNPTTMHHAAK